MYFQFNLTVLPSLSPNLIRVSLLSTVVPLHFFFTCSLCHIVFLIIRTLTLSLSVFFLAISLVFLPSFSICVCWIDCTSGYIFCPHFCSLPLASPSHSSLECRPTVGYYCLIKGRLGRRRPDKSIKLPLAVPEGDGSRWILSQQENIPGCTSSKWCQRMC